MLSCWFIPPSSMTLCNSKNKPWQISGTLLWLCLRNCEQLEFDMLKPFNSIIKSNSRLKKHLIKSYVLKIRAWAIFLNDGKLVSIGASATFWFMPVSIWKDQNNDNVGKKFLELHVSLKIKIYLYPMRIPIGWIFV